MLVLLLDLIPAFYPRVNISNNSLQAINEINEQ